MNGYKVLAFGDFFDLCLQKMFWFCKNICLWKISTTVKKFVDYGKFWRLWKNSDCGKFLPLKKNYLLVVNFDECEKIAELQKFPWLRKSSMTVEKFLDCEKLPQLWENSLIVENFYDIEQFFECGKFSWVCKSSLTVERKRMLTFKPLRHIFWI